MEMESKVESKLLPQVSMTVLVCQHLQWRCKALKIWLKSGKARLTLPYTNSARRRGVRRPPRTTIIDRGSSQGACSKPEDDTSFLEEVDVDVVPLAMLEPGTVDLHPADGSSEHMVRVRMQKNCVVFVVFFRQLWA